MGNTNSRNQKVVTNEKLPYSSQISLTNTSTNLSERSFLSFASHQSTCSTQRSFSRVSRRRWKESTLTDPLGSSKTIWPVPHIESTFLPEFPIGTNLNDQSFKTLELISSGAYGRVYKVLKTDDNKTYALKVLSKAQVISDKAVRQVKDEVSIQNICGHNPFIVNCPYRWQSHRKLYIVSEFIEGGELHDLCEEYGKLPESLVKVYVAEVALALDFLHNAGVIYRDLKAENILLDNDGHIQLIDFGLSKWLKYGTRTSTLCGTTRYMAPEVAERKPYGHAADWWSLGVLACKMLTTQYPTCVVPRVDNMARPANSYGVPGTLPESVDISQAARTMLFRLLDREPNLRLRSLLSLQQIAFFMNFNFADARSLKFKPKDILKEYFPDGPLKIQESISHIEDFDC